MTLPILNLDFLKSSQVLKSPYIHMFEKNLININNKNTICADYPEILNTGFFPLETIKYHGAFGRLIEELQGPEIAEVLTEKLGVELRDKPRIITIRRWSALNDGRIHNDGAAKIVTALIYLNDNYTIEEDGGSFRVLRSDKNFEDAETIVPPEFGSFVAFVRSDNSWHGHKPFVGERRVVQIAWLRSIEDFERKSKRGKFTYFIKKIFSRLSK